MGTSLAHLHQHPAFQVLASGTASSETGGSNPGRRNMHRNLIASNSEGGIYLWNPLRSVVQWVSASSPTYLQKPMGREPVSGEPAVNPVKTVVLEPPLAYPVQQLLLNRDGNLLALVGDAHVSVLPIPPLLLHSSSHLPADSLTCRCMAIGGEGSGSGKGRIEQAAWHPHSSTHLAVLYADASFRLYNVAAGTSSDQQEVEAEAEAVEAEQTFYLQPGASSSSSQQQQQQQQPLARVTAFAFGAEHLWEHFTVFFALPGGGVYALCPVVPFGSRKSRSVVQQLAADANADADAEQQQGGEQQRRAGAARAWLAATFPTLQQQQQQAGRDEGEDAAGSVAVLRARPHCPPASIQLQGPLPQLGGQSDDAAAAAAGGGGGGMMSALLVGRNSVLMLASASRGGGARLQARVIAGELEPAWSPPAAAAADVSCAGDGNGHVRHIAMIVAPASQAPPQQQQRQEEEEHGAWSGRPPPLLLHADVDLALPSVAAGGEGVQLLLPDPSMAGGAGRLYVGHTAGVDAITFARLPFSSNPTTAADKEEEQQDSDGSEDRRLQVTPLLDTSPERLEGVAVLLDADADPHIVAVSSGGESLVVPTMLTPPLAAASSASSSVEEGGSTREGHDQQLPPGVSADILRGPSDINVLLTGGGQSKALTLGTVEGRALLHQRCKLLHEKYIEYAHRAYVELQAHSTRLQGVVCDVDARRRRLQAVVEHERLASHQLSACLLERAHKFAALQQRLQRLSKQPALSQRPLTAAERSYGTQLGGLQEEVGMLQVSAGELVERVQLAVLQLQQQKDGKSRGGSSPGEGGEGGGVPDAQMRRLKGALSQLSLLVDSMLLGIRSADSTLARRRADLDA